MSYNQMDLENVIHNYDVRYDNKDNIIFFKKSFTQLNEDFNDMAFECDDNDNIIIVKKPQIYNENNKLITKTDVENIINKYVKRKVKVKKIKLYRNAMTHVSYTKQAYMKIDDKKKQYSSKMKKYYTSNVDLSTLKKEDGVVELRDIPYEVYEFHGDSVINYASSTYLFRRYDTNNEGFLTKMRSGLVNGKTIRLLSRSIGLAPFILMSKQEELACGREDENNDILEDVFESFISAIHEEFGISLCVEFIISVIEKHIDITKILTNSENHIDRLMEYYKSKKWPSPKYSELPYEIDNGKKLYKYSVSGKDGSIRAIGIACSKKKARQNAARQALVNFGII